MAGVGRAGDRCRQGRASLESRNLFLKTIVDKEKIGGDIVVA